MTKEEINWLTSVRKHCSERYPTEKVSCNKYKLYWLAGIIEGEGSFCYSKGNIFIEAQMCDEDVIEKATEIFGTKLRKAYIPKIEGRKPVYSVCIQSVRAVLWMLLLYPLMGNRRKAKIVENINVWILKPNFAHAPRGTRYPSLCHPELPRISEGKCKNCYMKEYRKTYVRKDRLAPTT